MFFHALNLFRSTGEEYGNIRGLAQATARFFAGGQHVNIEYKQEIQLSLDYSLMVRL
jgi:hypothetical protein